MSLSGIGNNVTIQWPESAIWAVVWLDMDRLATALLSRGASPDPQDSSVTTPTLTTAYFPSPLYLACCAGHTSVANALIQHNAKLEVLRRGLFGCFQAAAIWGHVEVLKQLVAKEPSILESRRPCSGLFYAASHGQWKAVEVLLDPEPAQGCHDIKYADNLTWTPLAAACRWSYPRTTETLLRRGADPNSLGPYGVDTPLWMAAVLDPSAECVRALLKHGADPNHKRLSPPLLLELMQSPVDEAVIVDIGNALLAGKQPINTQAAGKGNWTTLRTPPGTLLSTALSRPNRK